MQNRAMSDLMPQKNSASNTAFTVPYFVVLLQAVCFAILYAVWMLPKTIFLRNICLGIGAALSLFVISRYRKSLLSKFALPIYLLLTLCVNSIFVLLKHRFLCDLFLFLLLWIYDLFRLNVQY